MFRHPNRGQTQFRTVERDFFNRRQQTARNPPMRLQLLEQAASQKAGQLKRQGPEAKGLVKPTSEEITALHKELGLEPELDIVRTGLAEFMKERYFLNKDRDMWVLGGKKVTLSIIGLMFGGIALATPSLVTSSGLVDSLALIGYTITIVCEAVSVAGILGWKKVVDLLSSGAKRLDKLNETVRLLQEGEQHLLTSGK